MNNRVTIFDIVERVVWNLAGAELAKIHQRLRLGYAANGVNLIVVGDAEFHEVGV